MVTPVVESPVIAGRLLMRVTASSSRADLRGTVLADCFGREVLGQCLRCTAA